MRSFLAPMRWSTTHQLTVGPAAAGWVCGSM